MCAALGAGEAVMFWHTDWLSGGQLQLSTNRHKMSANVVQIIGDTIVFKDITWSNSSVLNRPADITFSS
jgi:hypothetical protein